MNHCTPLPCHVYMGDENSIKPCGISTCDKEPTSLTLPWSTRYSLHMQAKPYSFSFLSFLFLGGSHFFYVCKKNHKYRTSSEHFSRYGCSWQRTWIIEGSANMWAVSSGWWAKTYEQWGRENIWKYTHSYIVRIVIWRKW